jgi:hypothetical protein
MAGTGLINVDCCIQFYCRHAPQPTATTQFGSIVQRSRVSKTGEKMRHLLLFSPQESDRDASLPGFAAE